MFAPGTGRFLGLGVAALVALTFLWLFRGTPLPLLFVPLLLLGWVLWGFFAEFFRDPQRSPGAGIVSAADGRVRAVTRDGDQWRVSVFMNVTNVHVNRFPLEGRVTAVEDSGRGFRPAYHVEAAHNRQRRYALDTSFGRVEVIQMTGIVARRLVSFVHVGDQRRKGERLGMIVLGSRVDVLLPALHLQPVVEVGERVWAGSSTIAQESP